MFASVNVWASLEKNLEKIKSRKAKEVKLRLIVVLDGTSQHLSFFLLALRHLCRPCHNREKAKGLGKYICQKCHLIIDEQPLMFKNDSYHPDHFSCTHCGYVNCFLAWAEEQMERHRMHHCAVL